MAATGPSSPDAPKESAAASAAAAKSVASESTPAAEAATAPDDAKPAAPATAATAPPTYLSTKSSRAYALSKSLLSAGALDDALSTLEMALQLSRQMLDETLKAGGREDSEMHESLAPLYYLYGTTLLYSVEESDVMMANGQAGMAPGAAGAGGGAGDIEVPDESEAAAGKSEEGGDANEEEGEEPPAVADPAEDLQIAWENLDLARTILARLVAPFMDDDDDDADDGAVVLKSNCKNEESNNGSEYTKAQQKELLLDLAQVHVRLGDLQRADGNVLPSLPDYDAALKLRVRCLGPFDRKVADSHFSLAGVYAEAPSRAGENEGKVDRFVNSLAGGDAGGMEGGMGGGEGTELTEDEKREFRAKSLEHYLACGRAFVGILAEMCGEDAARFTALGDEDGGAAMAGAAASTAAAATGHCKSMAALRARLATLNPPSSPTARAEFDDLKEMIDEIQEAMDTAEETEAGLRSLGEMKANEIKKHEAKQNGEEGVEEVGEGGATTTIGFGAPSGGSGLGAASAAGTVNAFGSTAAAASASAVTAAPMMVVKKKKKKPAAPAPAEDSAKRLKTN